MVSLAVDVVYHRDAAAVIQHVVKAEIRPGAGRQQRVHDKCVARLRLYAADAGDDDVVEGRVVVVSRAFLVAFQPVACRLVEVFSDVRFAPHVLRLHVFLHMAEECHAVCVQRGVVLVQRVDVVDISRQGLRRGEGPHCAVPFTLSYAVRAELRVAPFGGGEAVRCVESLLVSNLLPCHAVFRVVYRHLHIPWHEADCLAHVCARISAVCLEEEVAFVPQQCLREPLQRVGFQSVCLRLLLVSGKLRHIADGFCRAIDVAVD